MQPSLEALTGRKRVLFFQDWFESLSVDDDTRRLAVRRLTLRAVMRALPRLWHDTLAAADKGRVMSPFLRAAAASRLSTTTVSRDLFPSFNATAMALKPELAAIQAAYDYDFRGTQVDGQVASAPLWALYCTDFNKAQPHNRAASLLYIGTAHSACFQAENAFWGEDRDLFWRSLDKDRNLIAAGEDPCAYPLLSGTDPRPSRVWPTLPKRVAESAVNWSFWWSWYESMLDPTLRSENEIPLLTELMTQPEGFWSGSDAEVNRRLLATVSAR